MNGSRPWRATSPRRSFHGHDRGRRASTPSFVPVPHELLHSNVPCDHLCSLRPLRTMSRPSQVARPRGWRRVLSSATPLGPHTRGDPLCAQRCRGLSAEATLLADVRAVSSAPRGLDSTPTAPTTSFTATSTTTARRPCPRAAAPHPLPWPRPRELTRESKERATTRPRALRPAATASRPSRCGHPADARRAGDPTPNPTARGPDVGRTSGARPL